MLDRIRYFIDSLKFRWRTRGMTQKQRLEVARQDLIEAHQALYDEFKDEPATRELINCFKAVNDCVDNLLDRYPNAGD